MAEAFGVGEVRSFELAPIVADCGARLRAGALAGVDPARHRAIATDGSELEYGKLAIATGAIQRASLPGALTFEGSGQKEAFQTVLAELVGGEVESVAFALPSGIAWALPLYELALMTAVYLDRHGARGAKLSLVTPEDTPLALFGPVASQAVAELLEERGIAVHTGAYPVLVTDGALEIAPGGPIPADRTIALPRLEGPYLPGLTHDERGFVPTDVHGQVEGVEDVYAIGDVTALPVKQGGLATQQADAVAEAIAVSRGADVDPRPFHPVLRGLLLTGRAPAYFRADIGGGAGDPHEVEAEPLWWPPGKIAGRYLSRYLATLMAEEPPESAAGIRVELDDLQSLLR